MDIETIFSEHVPQHFWDEDVVIPPPETSYRSPAASDFERLTQITNALVSDYADITSPDWDSSPIGWIRRCSSAHKRGKIGEEIVRAWAAQEGLSVGGRGTRGHDCIVAGVRIEVKTSLRWNNDRFCFLNLRDFDYDAVALLGLEPHRCGLWIVPKQVLWDKALDQERSSAWQDTKWLLFRTNEPPPWLQCWGGTFASAAEALLEIPKHQLNKERLLAEAERWVEISSDLDILPSHHDVDSRPLLRASA
jgi:hypothetical protein